MSKKADEMYERLLNDANCIYAGLKAKSGLDISYMAPEALPRIRSDQVKAVLMVLAKVMAE